jgi:hypothetical protein
MMDIKEQMAKKLARFDSYNYDSGERIEGNETILHCNS